ncbi:MAG TPA: 2-phospho-L-lactate transferase [Nitrososphaera sp.]
MIAIIAGGTGSVKLVRGLARLQDAAVIANVGDNIWLHGLYVCPDVDTVVYGLGGMLDEKRGWGVKGDTFSFLDQAKKSGVDAWFALGDRDLAMHVLRTQMLARGRTLTQVTAHFAKAYGIRSRILPASDDETSTIISTDAGDMHLQEFWVKNAGRPKVKGVRYSGIKSARATAQVLDAIKNADRIVIAPGNPVSSIGPTLALKGVKKALARKRKDVVAVSPLIGRQAVSGPAVKYMAALGIEASPAGVAEFYSDVAGSVVIDSRDPGMSGGIRRLGMEVHETNITMRTRSDEVRLGRYLLRKSAN